MITPRWWSQPFPPTGAIASEGIRNQLGRPPVDPLTVFVRETAQNSWDARLGDRPTSFRLELTTVAPTHRPNWERLLTPPANREPNLGIGRLVRTPNVRLLSVVDRGTKGLGGPTRADEVAADRRDWVSFVLNVGEKRDTHQGGGTYGYGKAVLYRMSKVGTILVYTRTDVPGVGLESRLIGIAMRESFDGRETPTDDTRPFTGRHWWGDVQEGHVEPLRGAEADTVARSLGLFHFADNETGTTLVVLDPNLDDFEDVGDGARHLANTLAWQLWPIMLPERGDNRLVAEVRASGTTFPVPDPAETYPLDMFVEAYRAQRDGKGEVLECKSPKRKLGTFAVKEDFVLPMAADSAGLAAAYAGVPGDPHHICLMRSPELVVRYLEQTETGSVNRAYAGVFRAADDLDDVFAASEPPTHDDWVSQQLAGQDKTFVNVTFRRIKEQLARFKGSAAAPVRTETGVALGAASNFLGGIVAAAFARPDAHSPGGGDGRGAGSGGGGRPSPTPRDRVRVTELTEPAVDEREGKVVLAQRFSVTGPGPVLLQVRLSVGLGERGREDDAPVGAARPEVLFWSTEAGLRRTETCVVASPSEVELVVLPVPDTITDLVVTGTRAEGVASS
ncbi:hypothetical protein Ae406Ps2_5578c [Pseudonocardia sp. Ae406_Ps2]|uniref:hypothetical protein n=1 Tax=unclassified Pseudonocardia TaxID=2619320 RepID=UPI00094AEA7E|nr:MULTISPECIES: hypothetical protein [unclassified Pseudonocardia]OLL96712.1 hypothetical protein Ae331Ps2_0379 [Pseudonocardia sp. Ae331_Ps2]OLM05578.1 hypothetical protein Ae406Ps2_5578c [Pseudonocardia sp. Ae406_Ps2]OLM15473.1 hypothetical protein Ae505Ps2_5605 [Pseudonocardia sp. Ae505_Ps2]OLM27154.1 hypothetical protein Ae706Ps2_5588c [Pseudonocardia sp. Ae706_Ps2]OLM32741.1 hypothetical protein Ae717Ps2_3637 [Pseudonocardia sp. Ae717_Ps2]